jgi:hypothetical protein
VFSTLSCYEEDELHEITPLFFVYFVFFVTIQVREGRAGGGCKREMEPEEKALGAGR